MINFWQSILLWYWKHFCYRKNNENKRRAASWAWPAVETALAENPITGVLRYRDPYIFDFSQCYASNTPPPVWFTLKQATTILLHIFMRFTWLWIIFSILKGTPVIFCRIFIFHENWVFVKIISFSLKLAYEVQKLATLSHILPMAGLQILPNGYFLSKFVQKRTKALPLPQILEKG